MSNKATLEAKTHIRFLAMDMKVRRDAKLVNGLEYSFWLITLLATAKNLKAMLILNIAYGSLLLPLICIMSFILAVVLAYNFSYWRCSEGEGD